MLPHQSTPHHSRLRKGFTIVELLVVVAILLVLAALIFSSASRMQRAARSAGNLNNIRQVGLAITAFSSTSGSYPRLWNNFQDFDTVNNSHAWFDIIEIRQALGDTSVELNDNRAVSQYLMSPSIPIKGTIPQDHPVVNHFALAPGPGNKHPGFNPPLQTIAVGNPSHLILLGDTGTNDNAEYSDGQQHLYQLSSFSAATNADPDKKVDMRSKGSGFAKFDFERHGNEKTHVVFCDGHAEARTMDEFYYKNFVPN